MKWTSLITLAITCCGVVLIGLLANFAFNFGVPVRFLAMLGHLYLGVGVLTGAALLRLREFTY